MWTIDLKDKGAIYAGPVRAPAKAGVTLLMTDDTFAQLAVGKLDGQKAFMTGKLKTKGNLMLATKLGAVLAVSRTGTLSGWWLTTDAVWAIDCQGQGEALDFTFGACVPAAFTVRPVYLEWRSCIIQYKSCNGSARCENRGATSTEKRTCWNGMIQRRKQDQNTPPNNPR